MSDFDDFATKNFLIYGKCFVHIDDLKKFYTEYRATKHALWMARVLRAHTEKLFYFNLGMNTISEKWAWAERKCIDKCIEKAKEFEG